MPGDTSAPREQHPTAHVHPEVRAAALEAIDSHVGPAPVEHVIRTLLEFHEYGLATATAALSSLATDGTVYQPDSETVARCA